MNSIIDPMDRVVGLRSVKTGIYSHRKSESVLSFWGALALAVILLSEPTEAQLLEEVVVTARQREERVQSVPIPITALTAEQLVTRNLMEIRDLEKLSPNTAIDYSSVNGTSIQVFMRGIGQVNWAATQDPKIGVYVDGVYYSRPQGALIDFNDVDLSLIHI